MKIICKISAVLLIVLGVETVFANATVKDIRVRQRWPWSRLVDIDYTLDANHGKLFDLVVEVYADNEQLSLPEEALSGDINGVECGLRRIILDPTRIAGSKVGELSQFSVTLTANPTPLYMIVDLRDNIQPGERIQYVYEEELTNDQWGAWERNPVYTDEQIESVIWTEPASNDIYRTQKMVLRRIHAGSFVLNRGSTPALDVTLTRDFYMGIFEVTHSQWTNTTTVSQPPYFEHEESMPYRPLSLVSYDKIRGVGVGANWPGVDGKGDYQVDDTSFMGVLRTKTGLDGFDLPTVAQWQYACRAGTTTYYYDGMSAAPNDSVSVKGSTSNLFIHVLGRYRYNGGRHPTGEMPDEKIDGPDYGPAIVGSYLPNAWGLFDMLGNLNEWCLDWYEKDVHVGGIDPVGIMGGTSRYRIGGYYDNTASAVRPISLSSGAPGKGNGNTGFRVIRLLP